MHITRKGFDSLDIDNIVYLTIRMIDKEEFSHRNFDKEGFSYRNFVSIPDTFFKYYSYNDIEKIKNIIDGKNIFIQINSIKDSCYGILYNYINKNLIKYIHFNGLFNSMKTCSISFNYIRLFFDVNKMYNYLKNNSLDFNDEYSKMIESYNIIKSLLNKEQINELIKYLKNLCVIQNSNTNTTIKLKLQFKIKE